MIKLKMTVIFQQIKLTKKKRNITMLRFLLGII